MTDPAVRAVRKKIRQCCDRSDAAIKHWQMSLYPIPAKAFERAEGAIAHAARLQVMNHWLEVIDTMMLTGRTIEHLRSMIVIETMAFAQRAKPAGNAVEAMMEQARLAALGEIVQIAANPQTPPTPERPAIEHDAIRRLPGSDLDD